MSGGGKQKQKNRRAVRRTALIYCEGAHDLAFVRHLIKLFEKEKKSKIRHRSKQGHGGAPDSLINEAVNVIGSFDKKIVKADRDREESEIQKAEALSLEYSIPIIWSEPCLEALLLSIIEEKNYTNQSSKLCKQRFEEKYIPPNKRTDSRAYEKLFTLDVINKARKRIPELNQLVKYIIE